MLTWLNDHGAKVLAGLLTTLAAVNKVDPDLVNSALGGDTGKKWVALGLAAATLLHTSLLTASVGQSNLVPPPAAKPTEPAS